MVYDQAKLSSNWKQDERRYGFREDYWRKIMEVYFDGESKDDHCFTMAERLNIILSAFNE